MAMAVVVLVEPVSDMVSTNPGRRKVKVTQQVIVRSTWRAAFSPQVGVCCTYNLCVFFCFQFCLASGAKFQKKPSDLEQPLV